MRQERTLNERQEEILKIIAQSHIQSATPVGSALVSDILGLSSATIRNVMGELEDMKYISKPHTSAGRVPTSAGYRYYIDHLLEFGTISNQQKRFIEKEYRDKDIGSIEIMLEKISHILSVMTNYAGMACTSDLKFYMEGTSNIADIPEFRNPQNMRRLLRLFDERTELLKILNDDLTGNGVKIHIDEEDKSEALKDLSLITGNYRIGSQDKGSLGVLGPMRMNYSTLIPLVGFLSDAIEVLLDEMEIIDE